MSGDSLSQEEIDALMADGAHGREEEVLDEVARETLGELGQACMANAATVLGTLLGRPVRIGAPRVEVVDAESAGHHAEPSAVVAVVEYTEGFSGRNVFTLSPRDASMLADLMTGGPGTASDELSELHASAIGEAMNQMMGSAAAAIAEPAGRRVGISTPSVTIVDAAGFDLGLTGAIVQTSFPLGVDDLLDATLIQFMPLGFARALVDGLAPAAAPASPPSADAGPGPQADDDDDRRLRAVPVPVAQPVTFPSLDQAPAAPGTSDISLLLDVPLQVTVELGRTQMRIRNVLELMPGSIIELDKIAGEPVDVLVNGKQIARGEVVVIDEEFGVRITDVASQAKRLRGLAADGT